jgi:nicotinamide mononucleotide transporter
MNPLDIQQIFFTLLGYPISYLEFFGVLSGLVAVALSARANIWSWPIGIINVSLSFFLFYQVQLYPDMFLQVFFFITNVLGWWRWSHPRKHEEDIKHELKVSWMNSKQLVLLTVVGLGTTALTGVFASHLHELFPLVFAKPSASPYLDSFVTVMSIVATYYMIQKKIECWAVWMAVDVVATYVYFIREIKFYSVLYLIFTLLAALGLRHWMKEYRGYTTA